MIDVGICQKNACNGSVARRITARLQPRHAFDLPGQIRRGVDQKPAGKTFGVAADNDARLRLWRNLSTTRGCAVRAGTIPLWQGHPGCAAQKMDANQPGVSESDNYVRSNCACVTGALEKDRNGFQHRFDPPLLCSSHKSHAYFLWSLHSTETIERSSRVS